MKNERTESHTRGPETLFNIELSRKQSLAERPFEYTTEGDTFSVDSVEMNFNPVHGREHYTWKGPTEVLHSLIEEVSPRKLSFIQSLVMNMLSIKLNGKW